MSPSTRIPSPSHAATAACPEDTVPPAVRRAGRRALPEEGTTSDRSSVTHETSRHGLLLAARPTVRRARAVYRAPQRNCRRGYAPLRARPRRGYADSFLGHPEPLSHAGHRGNKRRQPRLRPYRPLTPGWSFSAPSARSSPNLRVSAGLFGPWTSLLLLVWCLPHRVVAPRQEPKIPRSYTRIFRLDGTLAMRWPQRPRVRNPGTMSEASHHLPF